MASDGTTEESTSGASSATAETSRTEDAVSERDRCTHRARISSSPEQPHLMFCSTCWALAEKTVRQQAAQPKLRTVPTTLRDANAFVAEHHRHHKPVRGHTSSTAVVDEAGAVRGVAIIGRPLARKIDHRQVCEVLRVATDGCQNACSALYGACCRIAKAFGYAHVLTYTLSTEPGTSLRAAGWKPVALTDGGSWSRDGRERDDDHPLIPKVRWACRCSSEPAIDLESEAA